MVKTFSFVIIMKHYHSPTASPFLEFGEGAGDTIFLNPCGGVDDINTPPIILDIPIMFYEEAQTKIFVRIR